jgi:hypothetical protein
MNKIISLILMLFVCSGSTVDKKKWLLTLNTQSVFYVWLGDSNIRGNQSAAPLASSDAKYLGEFDNLYIFQTNDFVNVNTTNQNHIYPVAQRWAAENWSLPAMVELANYRNKDLYYFVYGFGGTDLANDWLYTGTSNTYAAARADLQDALARLNFDYEVQIHIDLGTNDAIGTTSSSVQTNLTDLINDLRTKYVPNDSKVYIYRATSALIGNAGVTESELITIRSAIENVASDLDNCEWIDKDPYDIYVSDSTHLTNEGNEDLALYLFNNVLK